LSPHKSKSQVILAYLFLSLKMIFYSILLNVFLTLFFFFYFFRLDDLKCKIEQEAKIDKNSQLIIFNNLTLESMVTEQQILQTYPIMDRDHPLILFSSNKSLSCDNLDVIKSSKIKLNRILNLSFIGRVFFFLILFFCFSLFYCLKYLNRNTSKALKQQAK
jgi:heme/copper-type cytochrome/quinol oxidase subunit 2